MSQAVIIDQVERFVQEFRQISSSQQGEAAYEDRLEMLFSLLFTEGGLSALGRLSIIDALEPTFRSLERDFAE